MKDHHTISLCLFIPLAQIHCQGLNMTPFFASTTSLHTVLAQCHRRVQSPSVHFRVHWMLLRRKDRFEGRRCMTRLIPVSGLTCWRNYSTTEGMRQAGEILQLCTLSLWSSTWPGFGNCCVASIASEQQHNYDLRRIYYIEGGTNCWIHHILPECIASNQSALRRFLSDRTTRGFHTIEPSSILAWIPVS